MALSLARFNRMVADHAASLYRMAYRAVGDHHEAQDLVQEAFRSAWKSRATFAADRSERAWLVAILRRRVVDHWRQHKQPQPTEDVQLASYLAVGDDPVRNEFTDEIQHALDQLSDELREALLLVVVAELTHQEAAELLDVPLGTVLSRVSRARKRMREHLLAAHEPPGVLRRNNPMAFDDQE